MDIIVLNKLITKYYNYFIKLHNYNEINNKIEILILKLIIYHFN